MLVINGECGAEYKDLGLDPTWLRGEEVSYTMTGEDGMYWTGDPITGEGGKGTCWGVGNKGERDARFVTTCRDVPESERRDISNLFPMLSRFSSPNLGYDTGGNA